MSVSCVGTCSNCGRKQFWLSDTLSLQLDNGTLKCLPHPAERSACEQEGLTLEHASELSRLYRETFYVCRNCGKVGEIIAKHSISDLQVLSSVRGAMKFGWGLAVIVVPFLAWMRWWETAVIIGGTLVALPGVVWSENRNIRKAKPTPELPPVDAPGQSPLAGASAGCFPGIVVGKIADGIANRNQATGPCCREPDWIEAFTVNDEDRVPCAVCGQGVMKVSEHAIH